MIAPVGIDGLSCRYCGIEHFRDLANDAIRRQT